MEEAVGQVAPVPPFGAGLDEAGAGGLAIDVSAVLPFADEVNTLSATVHVPAPEHDGPPRAVLVCWPGGSYSRAYWAEGGGTEPTGRFGRAEESANRDNVTRPRAMERMA